MIILLLMAMVFVFFVGVMIVAVFRAIFDRENLAKTRQQIEIEKAEKTLRKYKKMY